MFVRRELTEIKDSFHFIAIQDSRTLLIVNKLDKKEPVYIKKAWDMKFNYF